jgi:uncharacterized protein YggE
MNSEEPPSTDTPTPVPPVNSKPSIVSRLRLFLWKLVSLVLLIALVITITLWKPWQPNIKAGERTVSVTGTATLKAEPDEFVFNPSYEFTDPDKQAGLSAMTKKSDELVAKLKSLGVPSSKIKVDSNNYGTYYPVANGSTIYNLSLTITTNSKDLTQKVQDYLLTTSPSGAVTPSANFSTAKQKALEAQARDKAEQDARSLAEQSAKNLGFKVNKVKTVDDNGFDNFGGCGNGLCKGANLSSSIPIDTATLSVQPGENELSYSVKVTYYIR